jgi:hypothetical protein
MYHLTEAYLMSALICLLAASLGAVMFASLIGPGIAPGRAARSDSTADRPQWYNYSMSVHRFAVWSATLFTLAITVGSAFSAVPIIYILLVVSLSGLMSVLYLLAWRTLPGIRQAEIACDEKKLNRGRRAAKVLAAGAMLLTLSVIVALVYVLPGHFTYYPVEPNAVNSLFARSA